MTNESKEGVVWFRGKIQITLLLAALAALAGATQYSTRSLGEELRETTKSLSSRDDKLDERVSAQERMFAELRTRFDEREKAQLQQWRDLQDQLNRRFGSMDEMFRICSGKLDRLTDMHVKEKP